MAVDDRAQVMVRVLVADGHVERIDHERHVVLDYSAGALAGTRTAELVSTPERPPELFS